MVSQPNSSQSVPSSGAVVLLTLPNELLKQIAQAIPNTSMLRQTTLCNLALVCNYFRPNANEVLLEEPEIHAHNADLLVQEFINNPKIALKVPSFTLLSWNPRDTLPDGDCKHSARVACLEYLDSLEENHPFGDVLKDNAMKEALKKDLENGVMKAYISVLLIILPGLRN